MKVIDELKQLGWSDELLAAVGAVAGKVRDSAVDQAITGIGGSFASSKDYDSVSVTLSTAQLLDSTAIRLPPFKRV